MKWAPVLRPLGVDTFPNQDRSPWCPKTPPPARIPEESLVKRALEG